MYRTLALFQQRAYPCTICNLRRGAFHIVLQGVSQFFTLNFTLIYEQLYNQI